MQRAHAAQVTQAMVTGKVTHSSAATGTMQEPAQHRQPEWFLLLGEWLDLGKVPTACLQAAENKKKPAID
jgi:hypothetical protein